jgi:hypothetical protein
MRASECAGTGGRRRRILREEPAMPHTLHPEPTDDIKSSGLKATLPRVKVLQIFRDSKRRHLSAEDVFRALLAEGSDIGLATVYRVLVQFVQSGLLQRQHFEGGKAVFELDEGLHHDLRARRGVLRPADRAAAAGDRARARLRVAGARAGALWRLLEA